MGKLVSVDQDAPSRAAIDEAADVLRAGGVVVMPTDSVYGIGCAAMPSNPAHERIFSIKRRERSQTLPWLVADASELRKFGKHVPAWMERLAHAFWPGALTLVVDASDEVGDEYRAADGTIALRVPGSVLVRMLARSVGPLATTSANMHGMAAATNGAGIEPDIVASADLTLDAGAAPIGVASTIVGCKDGRPCVLREGAITAAEVLATAGIEEEANA